MEISDLRTRIDRALAASESVEKFNMLLASEGVDVEWSPNFSGVSYKPKGASTWLKGSSVRRDLAARGVMLVLERNAELRAAAKHAATALVGVADKRAQAFADARLARNQALDELSTARGASMRALPAAEADGARALAQAGPDPLAFLVPAQQVPAVLDDVAVTPTPPTHTVASAPTESDEDVAVRRNRAEAQAELSAQYRKLSAAQLIELRNVAKRPVDETLIALALLERILALALKWLSFGTIRISTNIASALQQRELVAAGADDELARRRRSTGTAAERLSALAEQEKAMRDRSDQLQDRKLASAVLRVFPRPKVYFDGQERTELARGLDESLSRAGHSTSRELTNQVRRLDRELAGLAQAEPKSISLLSRLNPASRAAFEAEYRAWKKRVARARELRRIMADRLAEFLRQIEQEVAVREAQREATERAQLKILKDEREALEIEVSDGVPAWRREAERAEPQQEQHRPASLTEATEPVAEDAEAAEREREALRRLGRLG